MKLLEKKTVLITGGSRGIGKGIVKVLIENGANVAFTYASSSGPALELSEKLNSNKLNVSHIKVMLQFFLIAKN